MSLPPELTAHLNQAQREAVAHVEGPLLVVAGAGTGKTRVITHRIAALIHQGIDPRSILAITFTNKAATEMRERVESIIGPSAATLSTYHSFCARFLRPYADRFGFTNDFTIYDRDDTLSLTNRILKDLHKDKGSLSANAILDAISSYKQEGLTPRKTEDLALTPRDRELSDLYQHYDMRMRSANALDFDDLLMKAFELLRDNEDICTMTTNRFRYLLIDEYQDTNRIQYEIVKKIATHQNVCATGDPDQSIYAWRGADIRNILDFERDFKKAKVVLLEENYRSTGCILKAASSVISNNKERKERGLYTSQGDGDPLKLTVLDNETKEAEKVAELLEKNYTSGHSWKEHAVFYRTNAQTRILERKLREKNIPYRLVGAVSFFKRKEVKDLIAYLTLLANPKDDQAFLRIINTPRRGIGKTAIEKMTRHAMDRQSSLFLALMGYEGIEGLTARATRPLNEVRQLFLNWADMVTGSVKELLMRVIEDVAFEVALEKEPDGHERLENVKELVTAAREFDLSDQGGLSEFLTDISLLSSTELSDGDEQGVTLMTVHSAKGLEFDHVIIIGLEEDLLPHIRSIGDLKAIEEERRLMYVAITRARKTLQLMRVESRFQWGQTKWSRASRFLAEIPDGVLEVEDLTAQKEYASEYGSRSMSASTNDFGDDVWDDDFSQIEPEYPVNIGDRVRHDKFGVGNVLTVSGRPPAVKVRIKFLTVGVRQLIWDKAPLSKE